MVKRKQIEMSCAFLSIFLISITLVISGCQKKQDSSDAGENKQNQENVTPDLIRQSQDILADSSLNIHISGQKINYLSDSIEQVRLLLGDQQEKDFGYGEGGRFYRELDANGIRFIFESKSGHFRDIIVKSGNYPIEGGGRVGDSIETVESRYPKGFFHTVDGEVDKSCYYYLQMKPNREAGLGFRFYFDDSDRVKTIVIGWWAFVP